MKRALYLEKHPELGEERIEISHWTGPYAENDVSVEFFSANEHSYSVDMSQAEAVAFANIILRVVKDIESSPSKKNKD